MEVVLVLQINPHSQSGWACAREGHPELTLGVQASPNPAQLP